jgi:hypothetical protein
VGSGDPGEGGVTKTNKKVTAEVNSVSADYADYADFAD